MSVSDQPAFGTILPSDAMAGAARDSAQPDLQAKVDRLTRERDETRVAIFGGDDYHPSLGHGNFLEMIRSTEDGRLGAIARAEEAEAKLAAALVAGAERDPAPGGDGWRVKDLEWEDRYWTPARWVASSSVGDYFIRPKFDGSAIWYRFMEAEHHCVSVEAAKAFAQADFDRRIQSCIVPAPHAPDELAKLQEERDTAQKELADLRHSLEHQAFKDLMTGRGPEYQARVWKQQAASYAHSLDAAEASLASVTEERDRLREFARWAILEGAFTGGDISGGEVQDRAVELGLLRGEAYDPAVHGEIEFTDPGMQVFVFTSLVGSPAREADRTEVEGEPQ